MSDARQRTRQLIESYLGETGLDASTLARMAKLAPSTITRFLNNPNWPHIPSTRTLEKLERAVGLWRQTAGIERLAPQPAGAEQVGRFVHEREQLAWLRIWDEMSPTDRKRAVLILRALASDVSKYG